MISRSRTRGSLLAFWGEDVTYDWNRYGRPKLALFNRILRWPLHLRGRTNLATVPEGRHCAGLDSSSSRCWSPRGVVVESEGASQIYRTPVRVRCPTTCLRRMERRDLLQAVHARQRGLNRSAGAFRSLIHTGHD